MFVVSGYHAKLLVIPSELHHEMEEVESIVLACCRLMDATEGSFMRETWLALPLFPDLDVATHHAESVESTTQNIYYVAVVFLLEVSG